MNSSFVRGKVSNDMVDTVHRAEGNFEAGDIHMWDRESASYLHHIRAPALGGDMTCIAWNPAADPFMFATGSHDGSVQIWTTSGMPSGSSRPIHPTTTSRTEALAPQPVEPSAVHLALPILRESSYRYAPRQEQSPADTTKKLAPPHEMLAVSSEPLSGLASRRHSWV